MMIKEIVKIRGTSSQVTFECGDSIIVASGEFFAEDGEIAGFSVSIPSLKFENGEFLTQAECRELIRRYKQYMRKPHALKGWKLRFE